PADKAPRDDYAAALEQAILEMQAFYQEELGTSRSRGRNAVGVTFNTFSPTVEVVVTPHDSAYYNANDQAGQFEFFFRAVGDGFGLPHPPGCDQGTCSAEAFFSLMFFGYTVYPDTYFLDEDKVRLEASPFFAERKIRRRTDCRGEPLN